MQGGGRAILLAGLRTHVELENTGDHDHGLWPIAVLEHREFHRLGTVHEHAAAKTALILHDPVAAAVPAHTEQGLGTRRRGRFTFIIHGTSPALLLRPSNRVDAINVLSNAYEFERDACGSS